MTKPDGGPAFPTVSMVETVNQWADRIEIPVASGGMTLRDYFAAHAPRPTDGILSGFSSREQRDAVLAACADSAYLWADAMLAARAK